MAFHVRKATKIIPHFRNGMRFLGSLRETPFAVHKIGNKVLGFENMLNHLSAHRFKSTKVEKQIDSVNDDRDNQVECTLIRSTLILFSNFMFRIFVFIIPNRF